MTCAIALAVVYTFVTVMIFSLGVLRAPDECELSGQDRSSCESTRQAITSHGRDSPWFGRIRHPHNR